MFTSVITWLRARQASPDAEAGVETVEVLSWAAMSVVAIVVIGGLMQALGVDIMNYVRAQLGV